VLKLKKFTVAVINVMILAVFTVFSNAYTVQHATLVEPFAGEPRKDTFMKITGVGRVA